MDTIFQNQNFHYKFHTQSVQKRKKIANFTYSATQIIGKGCSSEVFKGKNENSNQQIAIKIIKNQLLKDQFKKQLVQNEIENLNNLIGVPGILQLHKVFTTQNNTYIITQLCDCDLNKKIKKISELQAIILLQKIIEAYANLYKNDIIHRDLKPANILMKDSDIKIADFGFSILGKNKQKFKNYNVGSPLYMAPESLQKNQYSFESDIWSIGIIFFEMLYNKSPWKASDRNQLLKQLKSQQILKRCSNNISRNSQQFLRRALTKSKQNRLNPKQLIEFKFREVQVPKINIIPLQQISINQQNYTPESSYSLLKNESKYELKTLNGQNAIKINTISYEQKKKISKVLITQINFCRLLYKLINLIKRQYRLKQQEELINILSQTLLVKIKQLNQFEKVDFNNELYYEAYKQTQQYFIIRKMINQYFTKYTQQIVLKNTPQFYTNESILKFCRQIIRFLINELKSKVFVENIKIYTHQITILDYIAIVYDIMQSFNNSRDYTRFSDKYKLLQIIDDDNKNMNIQKFNKIIEKAQSLNKI